MNPYSSNNLDFGDEHRLGGRGRFLQRIHLDGPLLFALLLLASIGLIVIYSAGSQDSGLMLRQIIRLILGFIMMVAIAQIHPRTLSHWAPWIFAAGILMLVLVLVLGEVGKGAQRWLNLGLFRFQPSELMKLALPMMIAYYLGSTPLPPRKLRLLACSLLVIIPTFLVAKQPDLGTALLIASSDRKSVV